MSVNQSENSEIENLQHGYVETLNRFFESVGAWSFDNRWLVLFLSFCVFSASCYFASLSHVDMTFEAFFEAKDPTYSAYQKYREDFGSDEVSYILYEVPDSEHGPFDLEVMHKIAKLTQALENEVPFLSDVTSLANVEFMEAVEDGIDVHELMAEFPETQKEMLALRELVLDKPIIVDGILSRDGKFAAIILEMQKSSVDPPEELIFDPEGSPYDLENLYPQVSHTAITNILSRSEYAGIKFYHAGDVPWNANYNRIMIPQTINMTMLTYLIIGVLLYMFLRRVMGVIGPFIVVTISVVISAAVVGLMGWNIDLMFPFVPNLLIAIGVADSVHIVSEFNTHLRALGDRREAIKRTMYLVGTPCLLTSLTTAAGLLAMSFSNVKSLAHMSIYSATGIIAAFVFSVTLLMTIFAFGNRQFIENPSTGNRPVKRKMAWVDSLLQKIADYDIRHPKQIVLISVVIFAVSFAGMSHLRVDNDFMAEWNENEPVRLQTLKVDKEMGGMANVVYLFDSNEVDGIKNPEVLREIERVQMLAESRSPFVTKTYSIVEVIKDLNKTFHGDDPAYYVIPDNRELIAQLLLIYEMSGGDNLDEYVSADFSRANLEIRCRMEAVSHMEELVEFIDADLQQNPLVHSTAAMTGIGALWVKFSTYVAQSQIQGMMLAFCVIAAMMCLIFRSIKIGMLSMIPNLAPVFITEPVLSSLNSSFYFTLIRRFNTLHSTALSTWPFPEPRILT